RRGPLLRRSALRPRRPFRAPPRPEAMRRPRPLRLLRRDPAHPVSPPSGPDLASCDAPSPTQPPIQSRRPNPSLPPLSLLCPLLRLSILRRSLLRPRVLRRSLLRPGFLGCSLLRLRFLSCSLPRPCFSRPSLPRSSPLHRHQKARLVRRSRGVGM